MVERDYDGDVHVFASGNDIFAVNPDGGYAHVSTEGDLPKLPYFFPNGGEPSERDMRRGRGSQMLGALRETLKTEGIKHLYVESSSESMQNFCRKKGARDEGIVKGNSRRGFIFLL